MTQVAAILAWISGLAFGWPGCSGSSTSLSTRPEMPPVTPPNPAVSPVTPPDAAVPIATPPTPAEVAPAGSPAVPPPPLAVAPSPASPPQTSPRCTALSSTSAADDYPDDPRPRTRTALARPGRATYAVHDCAVWCPRGTRMGTNSKTWTTLAAGVPLSAGSGAPPPAVLDEKGHRTRVICWLVLEEWAPC